MNAADMLKELESLGSEQTRKTYRRHGARDPMFGVSYASFGKLVKKIKVDHELALGLWKSGNYDARILATMVADPARADSKLADAWVKEVDSPPLTDAVAKYLGRTRLVQAKAEKWVSARGELTATVGWLLLGQLAWQENDLPNAFFERYLDIIEKNIHTSLNRVKQAMHSCLMCIGARNQALRKRALAAARAIGKVDIDHGDTACKTPDAAAYIEKIWARKS